MIIFDLDGTLANCEHRRHFVDPSRNYKYGYRKSNIFSKELPVDNGFYDEAGCRFVANWPAFYEACDKDETIGPVISIWNDQISQGMMGVHQIWSGRCESVRKKTEEWLDKHLLCFEAAQLKMRPIGDNTPDDLLKERWLNERCADLITAAIEGRNPVKHDIEFVFDDRPKVVRMWRRRGIFVFNCAQSDGEF